MPVIWTIGHSTRPAEEFLALLKAHGIARVVDVRAFPGSRRHPQFSRERFAAWLEEAGVGYEWLGEELGGRRRAGEGPSPNTALRNASFRNYADYMLTPEFAAGVDRLLAGARKAPTAFLCAEALWWRCHRSLIADYLVAVRGWEVRDILDEKPAKPHAPKAEARREGDVLVYGEPELFSPRPPASRRRAPGRR